MPDRVVIKTNSKPEDVVLLLKRLINQKNCYGKKRQCCSKNEYLSGEKFNFVINTLSNKYTMSTIPIITLFILG